jgi:hypothetical protein
LFENPHLTDCNPIPHAVPELRLVDSVLRGFGPSLSY